MGNRGMLLLTAMLVVAVMGVATSLQAQTFTVGGYAWDMANGPTRVLPVQPSDISSFSFFSSTFLNDQPAFDPNRTLGRIMTGTTGSARFVELGNAVVRKVIQVDWGGKRLPNRAGEDFVVYEVGSPSAPEAFMVAVRKKGESTFSAWRYEFANSFTESYNVFATAFNLSDFGLREGEAIDAILIANLIEADRVDNASGQGNVLVGGGAGFVPLQGPQSNTPSQPYPVDRYDADIVYVAALHDILPPNVSVKGSVTLEDFLGDVTQVPVEVQLSQGGSVVRTQQVSLDSSGTYTLDDVAAGTYDIAFKASHWLRAVVRNVVVTGAADVTGVDVSLLNGDVDGDNEVGLLDLSALVAAFNSVPGDDNWNPDADLDGDGEVGLPDFSVLVRNFGAVGDEL